jgi:uncharacterized protein YuzE
MHSSTGGLCHENQILTDTDTLLMEFRDAQVAETRDLDENTVLDLDADGNVCAITLEHASKRAGAPELTYEQVTT